MTGEPAHAAYQKKEWHQSQPDLLLLSECVPQLSIQGFLQHWRAKGIELRAFGFSGMEWWTGMVE